MKLRAVVPARYASRRLPGKPLIELAGKPLVCHVCERALESRVAEVWLATDDERIAAAVKKMAVRVALTGRAHASGTDRIAEVAARENWADEDIVINLQGDEPLMPARVIDALAASLQANPEAEMATAAIRLYDQARFDDPQVVKLITDSEGCAVYFSRAPIPRPRDPERTLPAEALRHVGLYAYRVGALARLALEPPCMMEREEGLEQLRALWLGMRIRVEVADGIPLAAIDTAEDAARVGRLLDSRAADS